MSNKKNKNVSLKTMNEDVYKKYVRSRKFILFSQIVSSVIFCAAMGAYLPFLIPAIPGILGTTSTIIASSVCGGVGLLFGAGLASAKYNYYNYNTSKEEIQINNVKSNIIQARALEKIAQNIDKQNKTEKSSETQVENKPEKAKFSFVEKEKQKRAQQENTQAK